ncbi:hypothetical protein EON65_06505 [archaeon]|nr:MAG: hypothetical protein EON65_06505 [archaeon]
MRRTKSAVRWPAIKLFNYTGQSVVVKHIDIVYDIVSNQHHSNIALFLQFLRHNKLTSSSASTHTTTGDSAYPPPTPTPYTFTYLFLVPPNVNSQVLGMVDSFCTEINLGDDMDQNKGSSGGKKGRCTRHMKSTALLWEEAFGHFNAMPKKVDAVFMSRSSLVGPVLPHYAPEDFDVFKTFTQYLSPALPHTPVPGAQTQIPTPPPTSNPIVLSSVSVHFRNKRKKAYVSIETKDFPVMLSGEFARLLGKQERILFGFSSGASTTTDATSTGASTSSSPNAESTPVGGGTKLTGARSWLMPTLGGGLGIHVLDPHYAHIDWLRYYDLCYLKHTISLTACSKVEQTIPVDYAYIQAVGLNQTGIKSMFVKGINAMDMSIRTPLYGAYTSLFIDTTKLKSYEEYAYFVHVMNRQYNLTRDGSDHKGLDKKGGWTGYLSSLLTGGKGKSGHERSKKDLLTGDVTNSTMKNVANMHSKKTLVVYVYFEANQEAIDNFVFFAQNGGIMPSNLVDYVIVVQGKHTVAMPTQFNVRVIYKENTCFDIGSWGAVIREIYADNMQRKAQWDEAISTNNIQVIQRMQAAYKHYVDYIYKYKYYIVMNTSVRGPYLPPSWNFGSHLWTEAFTKHISDEGLGEQRASSTGFASKLFGLASITSSSASSSIESDPKHRVKLVGLSINCPDGVGRKYPHIMSMLLAFDNVVVDIWMNTKPNFDTVKLFTVATTKEGNPNAAFDPLAAVLTPTEDTILIDRPRNKKASQAQESLVFDDVLFCANQKEHSLAQESELSMSVFNAGYNIKSLQYYYRDMNWLGMYKQIVEDKKVETSHGHMISCSNILLDIFYKKAWNYKQTTPHPYDFVFVKTNRGIYKDDLFKMNYLAVDYRQFTVPHIPDLYLSSPSSTTPTHDITNTAATVNITTVSFNVDTINPTYTHLLPTDMEYYPNTGYQKVVVMFSHNFNFEGAPMWLLRIATILKKWGYRIYMYSLADGPLAKVLQKEGIQVIRFSKPAPFVKHESYKDFIGWFYQFNRHINIYYGIKPTMYLFNTVLFTKFVATLPIFQSIYVRYMWAIHEAELYDAVKSPNNYAYEHEFKELRTLNSVYLAPHKILFVSDSGRLNEHTSAPV